MGKLVSWASTRLTHRRGSGLPQGPSPPAVPGHHRHRGCQGEADASAANHSHPDVAPRMDSQRFHGRMAKWLQTHGCLPHCLLCKRKLNSHWTGP